MTLKHRRSLCGNWVIYNIITETVIASKSQLLYFPSNTVSVPVDLMVKLKSMQVISYADKSKNLGNITCSHDENVIIDNAINDRNQIK